MKIYPTILTQEISDLKEKIDLLIQEKGTAEVVQVDIIDGLFAENYTVAVEDLIGLDFGDLKLDFHLMVNDALDAIWEVTDNLSKLPVRAVIAQVERLGGPVDYFLDAISKHDLKAGLSFDLYTPIEELEPSWFEAGLKVVQIMGVEAGFSGQKFNELVYGKLEELGRFFEENKIETEEIEVIIDGGVNAEIVGQVAALDLPFENIGLAVNSALWEKEGFEINYERLSSVAVENN